MWIGAAALIWLFSGFSNDGLIMALLFGTIIFCTYILIEPAIGLGQKFKAIETTTDTGTNQVIREEQVNFGWLGAVIGIAIVYGVMYFLYAISRSFPSYVIADEVAIVIVILVMPLYRIMTDIQSFATWNAVSAVAKSLPPDAEESICEDVYMHKEKEHSRFNLRVLIVLAIAFVALVAVQAIQVWIVTTFMS